MNIPKKKEVKKMQVEYFEIRNGEEIAIRRPQDVVIISAVGPRRMSEDNFEEYYSDDENIDENIEVCIDLKKTGVIVVRCGDTHFLWVITLTGIWMAGQHTNKEKILGNINAVLKYKPDASAACLAFAGAGDIPKMMMELIK